MVKCIFITDFDAILIEKKILNNILMNFVQIKFNSNMNKIIYGLNEWINQLNIT